MSICPDEDSYCTADAQPELVTFEPSCATEALSGQPGCRMVVTTGICDPIDGCKTEQAEIDCPQQKCDCETKSCVF